MDGYPSLADLIGQMAGSYSREKRQQTIIVAAMVVVAALLLIAVLSPLFKPPF